MNSIKTRFLALLRLTERYTKTDMAYVFKTGFWSNAGSIFVAGCSFLLYVIFSHVLTKETYGNYQYLLSVAAIVGAFTLTGMNTAITRAVAMGQSGIIHQAMRRQMIWNLIPFAGATLLGLYYLAMHNSTLGIGLLFIAVLVPINSTLNSYGAILQGHKDFKRTFTYSLWWNIPYYIGVALAAFFFKIAVVLLAVNLATQTLGLYIAYRKTLALYPPSGSADPGTITYGNHLSVMSIFSSIASQIDSILAFHFLGAASLATYSFATAVPDRLAGIFKFIPVAAFPKFSEKTPDEIRFSLARRLWIAAGGMAIIALMYTLIAHLFFSIFFPAYLSAVPYTQLYAFIVLAPLGSVLSYALNAMGNIRALYAFNILVPAVQLILQVFGIIFFGLWGLIIAKILGNLIFIALGVIFVQRVQA
ncbi:MAG: polysaccharide biosynthesis protein [Parcubacteria group bacterium]|nr:polysaccharide biosynthesis protein [Parcubacteria group bacterium]